MNMWRCTLSERLRILKLLEDGKINAEEAARLLEASSHSEFRGRKRHYKFWSSFEGIPEIITSAITTSFKNTGAKETLQFPIKERIEFKGISGALTITGNEQDMIDIEKDGFAKFKEAGRVLEIKAMSGDVKITAPHTTDFMIKGISGDLKIYHLDGTIEIASVSGDIKGEELSGNLFGDIVSGNVDLDYQNVKKIQINSKTCDITLRLDKKIEAELNLETENANINCDFELKEEKREHNLLKGIINKPTAKIEIRNAHGDIAIKKRTSDE
jgi:DUF4097 and DUF4098 domain-containing protein YvlB